jgi:hypothetical protein
MRKASFVVEGADGAKVDISVTSFQGESGGLLANINRWRGQLGLDAVDAEQLESTVERRTLAGREYVIVDFVSEESPADKKQRIIGAIVTASDETWFFKMTGGDALTAAQKPAFLEVLKSVEFRSHESASLRVLFVAPYRRSLTLSMMLVRGNCSNATGHREVMSRYIRTFVVWCRSGRASFLAAGCWAGFCW